MPGKLNDFRINVPNKVSAGNKFKVKMVALDDYGNVITDFSNKYEGLNINVNIGSSNNHEHLDIPASEFKNGKVRFDLSYKKAGNINVSAAFEGISDVSTPISILAGPFHNLKIAAPAKVIAGNPFKVRVYAADQYGNPVGFMLMPNEHIKVYLTGDNFIIRPRVIPSSYIKDGSGVFDFISDRAGKGQLNFSVNYSGRNHIFISKNIDIEPSYFKKFLISTNIAKVPAGRPFIIKIVAIDRFANVISNINKINGKVKLVLISPKGIERSSVFGFKVFNKGVALVKTVFNRVGTFSIYAKPEKISLKNLKSRIPKANSKIKAKSLLLYK
jgi:S-adenosylmethionine hydrolase